MLTVGPLHHELLTLEPLSRDHIDRMRETATAPEAIPQFAAVPDADGMAAYVEASLAKAAAGEHIPFAQVLPDGTVVGHTSYLSLRPWPDSDRLLAIEIGSTWLIPSVQGTAVNTVAKLLLMTHAFESLHVARLDIKTDARNARARAGIVAVGARFEGVLRSWQPSQAAGEEGRTRDTAMHAVSAADWPEVKRALQARLAAKRAAAQDSRP